MEKGPVPKELALKWTMQVAVALHYLHQQHYIHRDVKPENIFIDEDDNAILGDLGVISLNIAGTLAGDMRYIARDVIKA